MLVYNIMSGSQNDQTYSTYYQPGYTTHGILGGPGFHPYGKIGYIEPLQSIGHPEEDSGPVSRFTAVHRKLKKGQKTPYVGGHPIFNQERIEPGYYKLSNPYMERYNVENAQSQLPHDPNFKYKFPEDMRHAVHIDEVANDKARTPHQWLRPDVEIDKGEDEMFDYFANITAEALESKKQLLRLKGFSDAEIDKAIDDLRTSEIQKNLKSANIVSLPSITTGQSVITGNGGMAMAKPNLTQAQRIAGQKGTISKQDARILYGQPQRVIQRSSEDTALELARQGFDPTLLSSQSLMRYRSQFGERALHLTERMITSGKKYGQTATNFEPASSFGASQRAFNIQSGVRRK